jgi:hypothetical protein
MKLILRTTKSSKQYIAAAKTLDIYRTMNSYADFTGAANAIMKDEDERRFRYYLVEKAGLDPMVVVKELYLDSDEFAGLLLELGVSSCLAYEYCIKIKDRTDIRNRITDSWEAYLYCFHVKDRKDMRDRITDSEAAYAYCFQIKDRKEIRDRITDSYYARYYCCNIQDRKEIRDRITDSGDVSFYHSWVKSFRRMEAMINTKNVLTQKRKQNL